MGRVSVTTTREIGAALRRSTAGSESTPWVAMTEMSEAPGVGEQLGRSAHRAGRVDHVVDQHAVATLDVTDHVARLDLVVGAPRAGLVDQRQVAAEMLAVALGHLHPAGVGRHHDDVVAQVLAQVALEHRRRHQVIERGVEEALDLARVQVDADHPVGPGRGQHVGHQLGRDRLASGRLPVLARVAVVGADRGDALGRGPLGGVDHDELLHQRVVHRRGVRLDDEDVAAREWRCRTCSRSRRWRTRAGWPGPARPRGDLRCPWPVPGGRARRSVPADDGGSTPRLQR